MVTITVLTILLILAVVALITLTGTAIGVLLTFGDVILLGLIVLWILKKLFKKKKVKYAQGLWQ